MDVESLEIEDERLMQSSSSERRPEEDGECTEEELIELSRRHRRKSTDRMLRRVNRAAPLLKKRCAPAGN
jgi:hypothetical protein